MKEKTYIAIDLKSFYASVECIERRLNPLITNLVVADESRTSKTICLAVTPSLKDLGIPGRPRLFEVESRVKEINAQRKAKLLGGFTGSTFDVELLKARPDYKLDYIVARPRMAFYIDYSTSIYEIYLKYVAKEDIHVYSIDEVFMDITNYIHLHNNSPQAMVKKILKDVVDSTGITATAGIGPNLYLAKIAMDIVAKHMRADEDGTRIAELDVMKYRKLLWAHQPIRDFWRVGKAYEKSLANKGIYTMGDVARCSLKKEEILYDLFGVNAELLIDHAWGYEPVSLEEIKSYKPQAKSVGSGQVLHQAYTYEKAKIVAWEMAEQLSLDLVKKRLLTNHLSLTISYDISNLDHEDFNRTYKGEITTDSYGRKKPKSARGSTKLGLYTSSTKLITQGIIQVFERISDPKLSVRKISISANGVLNEDDLREEDTAVQLDLFASSKSLKAEKEERRKERNLQKTLVKIKEKYGKSAILKGLNLVEGATTIERNQQIGGHKA